MSKVIIGYLSNIKSPKLVYVELSYFRAVVLHLALYLLPKLIEGLTLSLIHKIIIFKYLLLNIALNLIISRTKITYGSLFNIYLLFIFKL